MSKSAKRRLRKLISKTFVPSLLLLTITALFISFEPGQARSSSASDYRTVTVREGETLWKIAKENTENGDVGELVHHIRKLNNLSTSLIQPGQRLIVPTGE